MKYGTLWSREESVLALYLYCQIPFAQTKAGNPEVVRLANVLERTPSSVARKLGNFGAFDPLLAEKGIVGLTHTSRIDREVWDEFYGRWNALVNEAHALMSESVVIETRELDDDMPVISKPIQTDREATVLVRLCQSFFRKSVLTAYDNKCCLCGLDLVPLLMASHIIPWSVGVEQRVDPQNGLCLCRLHDAAFDRGLIGIKENFEIALSSKLRKSQSSFVVLTLHNYEHKLLMKPRRLAPRREYLSWHLNNVFVPWRKGFRDEPAARLEGD